MLKKFPNLDPRLTETEMVKELGYDRIWDCGLIKYVYTNPDYNEKNNIPQQGYRVYLEGKTIGFIKSRQELKDDCEKFLKDAQITKYISYTALLDWSKRGLELEKRLEKYMKWR